MKQVLSTALHGGDVIGAARAYDIPVQRWLDLSTGLNPHSYPVPQIAQHCFTQLPYLQPSFIEAAEHYYASADFFSTNGSQQVIQALPQCVARLPVLLPDVGYREHFSSWQGAGFDCRTYPALDKDAAIQAIDDALNLNRLQHLVLINPNNPTGAIFSVPQLLRWADQLAPGACMVVDEAFIDLAPEQSLLSGEWPDNCVVLRSFGKFFGLAGIRLGFAFCRGDLNDKLAAALGLWMINGPAQAIATQAFADAQWQRAAREKIACDSAETVRLLTPLMHKCAAEQQARDWLFISYRLRRELALELQHRLANCAILVRVIDLAQVAPGEALLRFGLIDSDAPAQVAHLARAVDDVTTQI